MPVRRQRFEVIAGDSFSRDVQWLDSTGEPQSFASYAITMEFRKRTDSTSSLLTLSEGSGITVAGDDLTFTWSVTPSQMLTLASDAGGTLGEDVRVLFDVVLTVGSTYKRTLVPGVLEIHADADR